MVCKMKNIETVIEENQKVLDSIEMKIDYREGSEKELLCWLLENVPFAVWEAIGFPQVREVTVGDYAPYVGDVGVEICIKMENRTRTIAGLSSRNPYWPLARAYKPYRDFCATRMREALDCLEGYTDFVQAEIPADNLESSLRWFLRQDVSNQYSDYFKRWNLEDDLIRYCIENGITEPRDVLSAKRKTVLGIFCAKYANQKKDDGYECNEWAEIEKYYTASVIEKSSRSFAEFANTFLSNQRSISELWKIVDEDKRRITERMSPKEQTLIIQIAENLLYERLCAMALGEENNLWSILGELKGYTYCLLSVIMNPACTEENTHELGKINNLSEEYVDYLIANRNRYAAERVIPVEEIQIRIEEKEGCFIARAPWWGILQQADTAEKAVEDVVEQVRQASSEHRSIWILRQINEEYPGYSAE